MITYIQILKNCLIIIISIHTEVHLPIINCYLFVCGLIKSTNSKKNIFDRYMYKQTSKLYQILQLLATIHEWLYIQPNKFKKNKKQANIL